MKIVTLSDTHNRHAEIKNIPEADIIIHSGDATNRGGISEVEDFLKWYGNLNYKHRIFIPGNHDFLFEKQPEFSKKLCDKYGVNLLIDESIKIDGYKIWGSPHTPWFHNWAFNKARTPVEAALYKCAEIFPYWQMIPDDIDILITHGPPYGILDELTYKDCAPKGEFIGCMDLANEIKRIKPMIHIFGHIHCGYGEFHKDGISYYNSSICDESYYPSNVPHLIEIFKED